MCFGVRKSRHAARNEAVLQQFVAPLEILDYPADAAGEYGEIRAHLQAKGLSIGPLDTLIAAHARYLGLILVSNNLKEFSRVPLLKLRIGHNGSAEIQIFVIDDFPYGF